MIKYRSTSQETGLTWVDFDITVLTKPYLDKLKVAAIYVPLKTKASECQVYLKMVQHMDYMVCFLYPRKSYTLIITRPAVVPAFQCSTLSCSLTLFPVLGITVYEDI